VLGIHRWLRAGLLFMLSGVLGACNNRVPDAPEPLDLVKPIDVAESGQAVRFEFETNARNFHPGRTYALELEVERRGPEAASEPDMNGARIPFEVSLQRLTAGTWQDVAIYDSYQAMARNAGAALPDWHASSAWRYASLNSGSGGSHQWSVVALPMDMDTRYRLDVRTVQVTEALQDYSARLRVHAARPVGK